VSPIEHGKQILLFVVTLIFILLSFPTHAHPILLKDDLGRTITVNPDLKRWISLAPHLTENIQAAGLAERLIAVDSYSPTIADSPKIMRLSGWMPHQPTLYRLQPSLVWVWYTSPASRLLALEREGVPIFYSHPTSLASIPLFLEQLKPFLPPTAHTIDSTIHSWHERLHLLHERYKHTVPVRVFHPFSWNPLLSFNHTHWLSEALHGCNIQPITDSLALAEPIVNPAYILEQHTDIILLAESQPFSDLKQEWNTAYPRLTNIPVTQIHPDRWHRPSIRFIEGLEEVCEQLHRKK
jgi:iron complex transport system substrate-binding protein